MLVWASGEVHSLGCHKDKASVVKEVRTDTVLFPSRSQSRFFRGLAFKRVRQSLCLCLRSSQHQIGVVYVDWVLVSWLASLIGFKCV